MSACPFVHILKHRTIHRLSTQFCIVILHNLTQRCVQSNATFHMIYAYWLLLENRLLYTVLTQIVFPRENGNSNWKTAQRGVILLNVEAVWHSLISALVCKSGRPNYYSSLIVLKVYSTQHNVATYNYTTPQVYLPYSNQWGKLR